MDGKEPRYWKCRQCGAALGLISANGDGVTQLLVYRRAVYLTDETPAEVDVLGPLVGRMPIKCDHCEQVSVWRPAPEAVLSLLEAMGVEQIRQFTEAFLRKWSNPSRPSGTLPK